MMRVATDHPSFRGAWDITAIPLDIRKGRDAIIAKGFRYRVSASRDPGLVADEMGRDIGLYTFYYNEFFFESEEDALWAALAT